MTKASSRVALSLVELLVVVAILAVLVGLLVPAVQKVRETAARVECSNHLKQIGMAVLSHHDRFGTLPQGGLHSYPAGDPVEAHPDRREEWSWAYQILPGLGQTQLSRSATAVVDATPVRSYYCPARRGPTAVANQAKIDYAGNAGTDEGGAGLDGVILRGAVARLRLVDIADGTSTTALVGEKQLNPARFGRSADDDQWYTRPGWTGDYEVYRRGDVQPSMDTARESNEAYTGFGSAHLTGFNVVFADGSVRHVRYMVDRKMWQRACVRNDGAGYNLTAQ